MACDISISMVIVNITVALNIWFPHHQHQYSVLPLGAQQAQVKGRQPFIMESGWKCWRCCWWWCCWQSLNMMTVFADRVEQHIHFWLGEEASTDEAAIAAYKVNFFNIINDMLVYGRNSNEKQMTTMIFSVSGARRAPGRGGDPAQGGSGSRKQEVQSSLTE